MKNMPAVITFATVAVLLLLGIAASFIDSIPFALIASYVVGFGCSVGFLAMFLADYGLRAPRLSAIVIREADERTELAEVAEASVSGSQPDWEIRAPFDDPITMMTRSTIGLMNDPATLSGI
jgi:hypothetical protein